MAWTASGWYCDTLVDALDASALAIDLTATANKIYMSTNSKTPDFTGAGAYSSTNEVSGTGYTAGGNAMSSPTLTDASGTITWDAADPSWASSTISNARGAEIYADALTNNDGIIGINFGADYSTTAGTFTIQLSASGISTVDMTP